MVHGRCGLALPRGSEVDSRIPQARFGSRYRSVHSARMDTLRDRLSSWQHAIIWIAVENPDAARRGVSSISLDGTPLRKGSSFPYPTTVSSTGSEQCSDRRAAS
jgi:hypothetical protein